MKPIIFIAALAFAGSASAQTATMLDTQNGHLEAVQQLSFQKVAIGHGQLKSYWRIEGFAGIDTSAQAVSQNSTIYGLGFFTQRPLKFDLDTFHWNSGVTLVAGFAAQYEWRGHCAGGLYLGLNL